MYGTAFLKNILQHKNDINIFNIFLYIAKKQNLKEKVFCFCFIMEHSPTIWVTDVSQNTVWETSQTVRGRWKINCCLAYFVIFLNHTVYPKRATLTNSSLRHGQAIGHLIPMAKQIDTQGIH